MQPSSYDRITQSDRRARPAPRANGAVDAVRRGVPGVRCPRTLVPSARAAAGSLLVLAALLALPAHAQVTVPKDWGAIPSAIGAGTPFRLLFGTSTGHNCSATSIATYNSFVQGRAAANSLLSSHSALFKAVGSTATVDARDNTGTTGTGVAIYWLGGAKVADNYADFYDGSWDSYAGKDEAGGSIGSTARMWTGSNNNGTKVAGGLGDAYLGAPDRCQFGRLAATDVLSDNANRGRTNEYRIYALSPIFQVTAPPPDAITDLTATAGVGSVTLEWTTPDDGGSAIGAYRYRQSADGGTTWNPDWSAIAGSGAATTSHTVTGLTAGTSYTFQVRAVNSLDLPADDSNSATATPTLPSMSIASASGGEATARVVFTVSLNAAYHLDATASWSTVSSGTATAVTDYTPVSSATLTVAAGNTAANITVTVVDDTEDELTETFQVTLSDPVTNASLSTTTVTGMIADDDQPTVSITTTQTSVTEGTAVELQVSRTIADTAALVVQLDSSESGDFVTSTLPGSVTIAKDTRSTTLSIATTDDMTSEANGSVTVGIEAHVTYVVGSPASQTVEIRDDDAQYTLNLASDVTVSEGDDATFTVTLSESPMSRITVDWSTSEGTAKASSDYTTGSGTLTFAAGATGSALMRQFTVTITDDMLDEPDEQFQVTLSSATGTGATIGTVSATATITDNDTPAVSIEPATAAENVAGGKIGFPVTLSLESTFDITVDYATTDGSAKAGADYTAPTAGMNTVTVAAGSTSSTIWIDLIDDSTDEIQEQFTVTLSNPSNGATLASNPSAPGTITDDDAAPMLSIDDASASEDSSQNPGASGSVQFPVRLSAVSTKAVTGTWSTAGGTATVDADFAGHSATPFNIPAGTMATTIEVAVLADVVDELPETFTVTLTAVVNAELSDATATGTIEDDDLPVVSIGPAADPPVTSVTEGATINFLVSRTIADTVDLAVALAGSQEGAFVETLPTAVTIPANSSSATVAIATVGDEVGEDDGSVTVEIGPNAAAYRLGAVTSQKVVIKDDDVTFTLGITGGSASEDDDPASIEFAVTLTSDPSDESPTNTITVDWATRTASDETAAAGADYAAANGTLTFAAGSTAFTQRITIDVKDDDLDEPDTETFSVLLSNPTGTGATIATVPFAQGVIGDNDVPELSIADAEAGESSGPLAFQVMLAPASSRTVTVQYATTDVTATAGADYAAPPVGSTLTFTSGQTTQALSITLLDDLLDEATTETLTVTLSNQSAFAQLKSGASSATGTIFDDDGAPTLSIAGATVGEAATSIVFPVALTSASANVVTATWSTADGTALAGTDYTAVSAGSLTVAAEQLSAMLTVQLSGDDQDDEPDKTFTVTLADVNNADEGTLTATGTIEDDDNPKVSIAGGDAVTEGGPARFTLTRTGVLSAPLEVSISVKQDGSFIDSNATLPQTATFGALAGTAEVSIATENDQVQEAAGSITITVQTGTTYDVTTAAATVTVNDDNDLPELTIEAVIDTIIEGEVVEFRVTRVGILTDPLDFKLDTSQEGDYTSVSFRHSYNIPANEAWRLVSFPSEDDDLNRDDGSVTASVSAQDHYRKGTPSSATVTILDNDETGVPRVTIEDVTCDEDIGTHCILTITLSSAATTAFTAILRTYDGTATGGSTTGPQAGQDFKHRAGNRVMFEPSATSEFKSIRIYEDVTDEENETFRVEVTLDDGVGPEIATIQDGEATVTIVDNDDPPSLRIADSSATEDAGVMAFRASLNRASGKELSVDWATANGSARAPADYTAATGTVTFTPGETQQTIEVAVVDDSKPERTETFQVTVSRATGTEIDDLRLADAVATGSISDNDAEFSLTLSAITLAEAAAEAAVVTVSTGGLTFPNDQTIALDFTGSTAAATADYTITQPNITIRSGDTSGSVTITAVDDSIVEGEESIALTARHNTREIGSATITITDNDTLQFELSVSATTIEEGDPLGNEVTVTVSTGGATLPDDRIIDLDLTASTATETDDYTIASRRITITPGTTSGTTRVTVVDDSVVEADESINIAASLADNTAIGSRNITITDNDTATFSLIVDAAIAEGGQASVTVAITNSVTFADQQSIALDFAGSTATAPDDYTVTAQSIALAAAATAGSVTITSVDDSIVEGDESIAIAASHDGTPIASATITITDNDAAAFSLTVDDTVAEGGQASVTVAITNGVTFAGPQSIALDFTGTATAPDDYTVTAQSIALAAAATAGSVTVTAVDDSIVEGDESVAIAASHDATPIASATITITDNDTAQFALNARPTTIAEDEQASVTVTITNGVTFADPQSIALDFTGTATAPDDYTVTAQSLTIAAGASAGGSVTIAAVDDTLAEEDETIAIAASHGSIEIATATVTIAANDQSDFSLAVDPATIAEGDPLGSEVTVTVSTGGATFLDDQIIDLDVTASTATDTDDYTIAARRITIAPGTDSGTTSVTVVDDSVVEADESITIAARLADNTPIGTRNITITDNDTATLRLTADATIAEGEQAIATVTTGGVTFADDQDIVLAFDGASTAAESDYQVSPESITLAAGAATVVATITALDDTIVEGNEELEFTAAIIGTAESNSATITITDNDAAVLTLSVDQATIAEGEATILTLATGGVTFATPQEVELEFDGTAAEADYEVSPSSVTLATGATTAVATITALDDTEAEQDETIEVTASIGTTRSNTATVIISANDTSVLTLSASPSAIAEGEATILTLATGGVTFATPQEVELEFDGTAAEADYEVSPSSVTLATGATTAVATITALDDTEAEQDETIEVTASIGTTQSNTATVIISANDQSEFELSVDPATIDEGQSAIVTVTTGGVTFEEAQTIDLDLGTSTATDGDDYRITPPSITIASGETAGSATITTVDDTLAEGDETITVGASHGATPIGTRNITIRDNDVAFSLSLNPSTIDEGGSATVTVSTGGVAFDAAQTITLQLGGSATATADYTVAPESITIAVGRTTGAATITAVDDAEVETDETVTITARHGATVIGSGEITIRDNDQEDTGPQQPQDTTRPEVTGIASTARFPTNAAFTVTIEFSESVSGLTAGAIEVRNGAAASLQGTGGRYTVEVTPAADFEGAVTVTVPAGAATDEAGNGNLAGSAEFLVDTRAPTVRETTLDQPLEQWTAPTDTGAAAAAGSVRYPNGAGGMLTDAAAGGAGGRGAAAAPGSSGDRDTLTLRYSEPLDEGSVPAASAFAVWVDGSRRAVAAVTVRGARVRLTLAAAAPAERPVTMSYTAPKGAAATPIRDRAGNAAGDLNRAALTGGAAQAAAEARYRRANRALLPYLAVTMHAGTLAAVSHRIDAAGARIPPAETLRLAAAGSLAGAGLEPGAAGAWAVTDTGTGPSLEQLLDGTDFVVPLAGGDAGAAPGAAAAAVWGTGDYRSLSGAAGAALEWSGDLLSVHVGTDLRVTAEVLAGVVVSWSQGKFDYTDRSAPLAVNGEYESDLLSVHPYASWSLPGAGLGLWMSAGYGWGEVRIDDGLSAEQSAATRLLTGAVGGSGRLLSTDALIAGGSTALRLKGDASLARIDVAASGPITALELDTRRLRLLLEGSHTQSLPWGGRLTPALEVGLRYDDGAGPDGAGLELGGELSYADPGLGLTVQGHGRLLATHRTAYEEWGAGGLLRLELGLDRQGLMLTVAPSWGAASSGTGVLWERGVAGLAGAAALTATGGHAPAGRLEAEVGYGLPALGGAGVVIPYGGLTLAAEGARDYRLGTRLELPAFNLSLEGTRREGAPGPAEHGITLRGGLRY